MGDLVIRDAMVVLADRVVAGGVRCRDGAIIEVSEGAPAAMPSDDTVDADGAWVIPGVVDLHNDALEFELHPRSTVTLPLPFALATMERRLAGAGVTTEFHAVVFMHELRKGRTVADAERAAASLVALDDSPRRMVRHNILHRLDVRTPGAVAAALPSLRQVRTPFVSLNDHTPGQGQYRDVGRLIALAERNAAANNGQTIAPETYLRRMAEAAADPDAVPVFYGEVARAAAELPLRLATHDDDTVEKVDAQAVLGATVAEFPVSVAAAARARELGMTIVVGAPNVVQGGSQSGNLAAHELIRAGLADVLCADYHAPSLLPAAWRLVAEGLRTLPEAVAMVTRNAARAVGLSDRGEIAPGLLADLALVRTDGAGWPHVERTWVAGREVSRFGRFDAVDEGAGVSLSAMTGARA